MHRKVGLGYCGAGSVALDADAFADVFAAADGKAVAGTALDIVRKAERAGRPAACIPYHASCANVHRL